MKNVEELFKAIQKLPDPEMLNHFVQSTIKNVEGIVRQLEATPSSSGRARSKREDIDLVLNLVERTTRSLANSVRQFEDETETDKMEFLQQDFFNAAQDLLGDSSKKKDIAQMGKIGAIIEELDVIKQKYSHALKLQDSQQKQIDYLKRSHHRSQFGNTPSVLEYFDPAESPNNYTNPTKSYQDLDNKPSVDGKEPGFGGAGVEEFLDEANTKAFWMEVPGGSSKKDADLPDVSIGKLWQEVQRLRISLKSLETEKRDWTLRALLDQDKKSPVEVIVEAPPPPPPPPVPGAPPPPPAPGISFFLIPQAPLRRR